MFEIFKEFRFEAAHALEDSSTSGGRYSRLHGHSYRAQVFLRGEPQAAGWIMDLGQLELQMGAIRARLDHQFLNEINDLGPPTLEHLARFIWQQLAPEMTGLHKVIVNRDSCFEGCIYYGPGPHAG